METQISTWICDRSHLASVIKLGGSYYPEGHLNCTENYLKWLYLDNPEGAATLIVAHEGDFWIGLMALIPVRLEYQGQLQKACFAVNVLTHPQHRNKNLFVKMIKCARDFLSSRGIWLFGHPNANAIPGWKRQKMMFRNPLRLFLVKFKFLIKTRRIRSFDQLKGLPSSFWSGLTDIQGIHLKYTPEFIKWRFLDAPHREYFVVAVENSRELFGLRVTRHFKGPVDLMVDYMAPVSQIGKVFAGLPRPTLLMHSGIGHAADEIKRRCWRLPFKRTIFFFLTTWEPSVVLDDRVDITLAGSDF